MSADMPDATPAIIAEIIEVMRVSGEFATDGECLDGVATVLERHGYTVYPEGYVS